MILWFYCLCRYFGVFLSCFWVFLFCSRLVSVVFSFHSCHVFMLCACCISVLSCSWYVSVLFLLCFFLVLFLVWFFWCSCHVVFLSLSCFSLVFIVFFLCPFLVFFFLSCFCSFSFEFLLCFCHVYVVFCCVLSCSCHVFVLLLFLSWSSLLLVMFLSCFCPFSVFWLCSRFCHVPLFFFGVFVLFLLHFCCLLSCSCHVFVLFVIISSFLCFSRLQTFISAFIPFFFSCTAAESETYFNDLLSVVLVSTGPEETTQTVITEHNRSNLLSD